MSLSEFPVLIQTLHTLLIGLILKCTVCMLAIVTQNVVIPLCKRLLTYTSTVLSVITLMSNRSSTTIEGHAFFSELCNTLFDWEEESYYHIVMCSKCIVCFVEFMSAKSVSRGCQVKIT